MAQNVKTVQGVAIASVKTVQGVAIANVKTIQGVDNTGGGGPASFSDDFNRADGGLGGNWTTIFGTIGIVSNAAKSTFTGDYSPKGAYYSAAACAGVSQYGKITISSGTLPGLVFRFSNGSSPFYIYYYDEGNQSHIWAYFPDSSSASTVINNSVATGISHPITVGVTVIGTGTSTVMRVWNNPTANTPDAGGTTWDSAAPFASITEDPAVAADVGLSVGIFNYSFVEDSILDDWFAGDVP